MGEIMHKKPIKRNTSLRLSTKTILIILSILCVFSVALSFFTKKDISPITNIANSVLSPMQRGISSISSTANDIFGFFQNKAELKAENEKLKKTIDELNTDYNMLSKDREELDRLRKQLQLNEPYSKFDLMGARIISKDPGNWFNVFTIDKGSRDGIKLDMNVIANGGLVGIVSSVNSNSATVRTIIDDLSSVSSVVQGQNNLLIVEGNLKTMRDGYIIAKDIHSGATIRIGDKIVTSSMSKKFLPDIVIGYVNDVEKNNELLKQEAKVTPLINFNSLREVMVIKQLKEHGNNND